MRGFEVSPPLVMWAIFVGLLGLVFWGLKCLPPIYECLAIYLGFEVSPLAYGCLVILLGFEVSPPICGCLVIFLGFWYFIPYVISYGGCRSPTD